MNMEYYHNYKIVKVIDENGNEREIDYTDNIKDILTCENAIEQVNKEISELREWIDNNKPTNKKMIYKLMPLYAPLLGATFSCYLSPIIIPEITNDITGKFIPLAIEGAIVGLIFSLVYSGADILSSKAIKKEYNGKLAELYAMEEIVKDMNYSLEKLNDTKNISKNDEFEINNIERVVLDPENTLKTLKFYRDLFNSIGYNERKYIKYYNKGILDSKLSKKYDKDDAEVAKKYIEDRAKVLRKEKKF